MSRTTRHTVIALTQGDQHANAVVKADRKTLQPTERKKPQDGPEKQFLRTPLKQDRLPC
jgi:hypothetical protein